MTTSPPPRPSGVPPRRMRPRTLALLLSAWFIAVLIDHRGSVQWDRPWYEINRDFAYIHVEGGRASLSKGEAGSRGVLAYSEVYGSLDRRLFATDMIEWRRLSVTLDERVLPADEVDHWREIAAQHFDRPRLRFGDVDRIRRLWLGYPLEPARVVLTVIVETLPVLLALICLGLLIALLLTGVRWFDPQARRARALQSGRCPGCGYSLVGLTLNRCPECGATWLASEVEAKLEAEKPVYTP